jgi:uncharacterized membrane protein
MALRLALGAPLRPGLPPLLALGVLLLGVLCMVVLLLRVDVWGRWCVAVGCSGLKRLVL